MKKLIIKTSKSHRYLAKGPGLEVTGALYGYIFLICTSKILLLS
jgi:hypothetical protein